MANFKVTKFNGMAPAISPRLLSNDYAQEARDVDFLSGKLEPTVEDLTLGTSPSTEGTVRSLYEYEYDQTPSSTNANTDIIIVAGDGNTKGWYESSVGTANFVIANQYDLISVSVVISQGSGYGAQYTLQVRTNAPYPYPGRDHFGSGTITVNFFSDSGFSSAVSGAPSISNLNDTSEVNFYSVGSVQTWQKIITEAQFNAIVAGTTYYVRLGGADVNLSEAAVNLGSAVTNKSFVYIPPPLANLDFPPARYIETNYDGYQAFIPSEFIKIAGDVRSNLRVGGTLTGGTPARTAEITFFSFDGTNTIIFFKRTHFIASGTHTGTHEHATVLVDANTSAVANADDDSLIGYTLTNFGSASRTEAVTYLLPEKSTGYITDNVAGSDSVTVNDLHTYDADTSDVAVSKVINSFLNTTVGGSSIYTISVEPRVDNFTGDDINGDYYSRPGVEGVFGGFFNTYKLLRDSNLSPRHHTNTSGGVTRSAAYSKTGYGLDPYFANKDSITSRKMIRSAASDGNDGNDNDTHTAGETIDFTYAMAAYSGTVTSSVTDNGGGSYTFSDTNTDIGRNDAVNGFKFHNLTSGAIGDITDSTDGNPTAGYTVNNLSGGSRATVVTGDSYKITKTANVYEYEWYSYHKDHPFAQLVGAPGNAGVMLCSADAIISDQVQTLADPTGTDNLSGDFTLSEGDCVQFQGWGVDPSLVLANATQQASNSFIDFENTSTSTTAIHMYRLPDGNAVNSAGDGSGDEPYFRRVDRNINWFSNNSNAPQAESHSDRRISTFNAANGGPYWLIIDDPVKVHLRNGIITPLGSTKSIITGYHTGSDSANGVLSDSLKNFPINADWLNGKTIVNYSRGWKAKISSNTSNTVTVDTSTEEYVGRTDAVAAGNLYFQHIATRQYGGSAASLGNFFAGDYYYIEEAVPATTAIGGQLLTEENFTFRALSVVSIGDTQHLYNVFRPSYGVWWYASRYGGTQITTTSAVLGTTTSYLEFGADAVHAVSSPVTSDRYNRFYWTSADTYPQVAGGDLIPSSKQGDTLIAESQWNSNNESTKKAYRLGIPAPALPLEIQQASGDPSDLIDVSEVLQLSYVYTYVSVFGEEGPPSIPSDVISFEFGQEVLLTGIGKESEDLAADPSYNFGNGALKRIYRSNTGSTDTQFQFVDEIPFKQTFYVDTKDAASLGEVLPSTTWVHPPNDDAYLYPDGPMQGLVELPNGVLAGFAGKRLCFSESFLPHAWPIEYRKTVEEDIIALGATSNGVFVLTKHKPYFFSGSDPSAMVGQQIDFAQACVNVDSVVDMGDAIYYAGPDGLCAISTNRAEIITRTIISPKQWREDFESTTYKASKHESKYIGLFIDPSSNDDDGFIVDGQDPEGALSLLNRGTGIPRALYNQEGTDTLVVLEGQTLKEFRGGTTSKTYTWKSKKFHASAPISMSWVYIHADSYPLHTGTLTDDTAGLFKVSDDSAGSAAVGNNVALRVKVFGDGTLIADYALSKTSGGQFVQETLTPNNVSDTVLYQPAMRLPNNHALEWEIEISGNSKVNEVMLAQSTSELIQN